METTLTHAPAGASLAIQPANPGSDQSQQLRGYWVLLWSQSQCALHVETLEDMMTSNRRAYGDNRPMDYVPLLIAKRELVDETAAGLRGTLALRQAQRPARVMQ